MTKTNQPVTNMAIERSVVNFPQHAFTKEHLHGFLLELPVLFAYVDRDLTYKYVNNAYAQWIGKPAHQIVGKTVREIIGSESFELAYPNIQRVLSGERVRFENTMRREGETRYLEVFFTPDYESNGLKGYDLDLNEPLTGYTVVINDITEKTLAKAQLTRNNEELRDYLDNGTIGMHWVDAQGIVTWVNRTELEMLGYREHEYVGRHISEFHADPDVATDLLQRLSTIGTVQHYEATLKCRNGGLRHVLINSSVLWEGDKFIHTRCFTLDLTDYKRALRAWHESDERFNTLARQLPLVIWMTDEAGRVNYISSRWKDLTGQPVYDALENGWMNFIHPDDRERVANEWVQAVFERKTCNLKFRHISKQSEYIIANAVGTPRYSLSGDFAGYIGFLQDISVTEASKATLEKELQIRARDLVQKNIELKESEERYHRMIAEVQDYAIIFLNVDGIIQNWNKGAAKIKGYSAEDAVGNHLRMFYTAEDQLRKLPESLIAQAVRDGKAHYEGWRVRKDGTVFWGSIVLTAIHDEDNKHIGFSKVTRDLTERKISEDQLRRQSAYIENKNRELEQVNEELVSFAYVASHDLQAPLRKIQAFTSRILEMENDALSEKGKDYFHRIQNAAGYMKTLIEDLLMYSRAGSKDVKFETLSLNTIVLQAQTELREFIEEKHARIDCGLLPEVSVVRFQFVQLFLNMLNNSLKYGQPGVAPHIVIKAEIVKGEHAPFHDHKHYHHISFEDNGIGFEPQYKKRIFEVFQRLHDRSEYSGTGIGLAICKKIVENHQGIITAEGEVNKGAVFHIYLPA